MMGDIIIRLVNLPAAIRAYTLTDHNDDYNIYVNNALNSIEQQKAVDHELKHINADHFYRDTPVSQDELEAESKPVKVTPVQVKPVAPDFRQLRLSTGLSAYQVSKFVGISTGRYIRIEQGLSKPMPDELMQLTSFFKRKAGV